MKRELRNIWFGLSGKGAEWKIIKKLKKKVWTKPDICVNIIKHVSEKRQNDAWLSLVERCVRDAEVAGSNPVASTLGRGAGILKHKDFGYFFV